MSVCDLAKDFPAYRNKLVTVRGVYYYGLRQSDCPQKCDTGALPSFLNLEGGADAEWSTLNNVERKVEADAKTGKRFEIWVTITGRLETTVHSSPLGPCDRKSWGTPGFGHLGAFPSRIVVESVKDIAVKENPQSLYDYGHMYHGPA